MKRLLLLTLLAMLATNAYAQNIDNGLVGYWPFNGNTNDESGNGNNGTAMSNVTLTTDRFGNPNSAYEFSGAFNTTNKISIPSSQSLNFTNAASFVCWIKMTSFVGMDGWHNNSTYGSHCLFAKSHDRNGIVFNISGNQESMYAGCGSYGITGTECSSNILGTHLNEWVMITYVITSNYSRTYINNQLSCECTGNYNVSQMNGKRLFFGQFGDYNSNGSVSSYWDSWYPFHGSMDDVRIYNRELSNDEISILSNQFTVTLPTTSFSACPLSSIQMPAPVIHNGTPNASYTYSWTPANLFANPYIASPNTKQFSPYNWGEYNVAVTVTESGTGKTATCSSKVLVNYSQPFSLSKSVIQRRIANPVINLNEFIEPYEVWASGNAPAATPTVYKWYDRFNELIGTVTNPQEPLNYVASNARGIYRTYVVAENGECQSDSRNFYIFYTLRREGDESGLVMADGAALDAYPVPTDGRLSIDAAFAEEGGIEISVIDILGSERIKFHRTGLDLGEEIDLGSLPAGVYFLTVQSGNTTLRKQIVKQ